jgi:hypothetical protein
VLQFQSLAVVCADAPVSAVAVGRGGFVVKEQNITNIRMHFGVDPLSRYDTWRVFGETTNGEMW